MKVRNFFVSNSSSSSFIVIGYADLEFKDFYKGQILVVDGNIGETKFGWEEEKYCYYGDRINFSYLQAIKPEWLEMLEKVIKEHTGAIEIVWNITDDYYDKEKNWGYIDHQSAAREGENIEMFESEDALKRFLFARDSYIQGGNDNSYYED